MLVASLMPMLSESSGAHAHQGESSVDVRPVVQESLEFDSLYDTYYDFVHRSLRRLGVVEAGLDDAVQDVFVVVYRRLSSFEGRSTVKTWLFGIALRVARSHRRTLSRKGGQHSPLPEDLVDQGQSPLQSSERKQALAFLDRFLESLDEDKRAVFIMAELEQMTAPEIEQTLGVKLNTVYSRLRAARRSFEAAVKRHQAQEANQRRTRWQD